MAAALRFGRDHHLEVPVRGGAHNFAGYAVGDRGLVVDLSGMNAVTVDPATKRAVCGGGATWEVVDAATQVHGLAVPGGVISHTGIGGLTLWGGFGWLTAKAGLSYDDPGRGRGGHGGRTRAPGLGGVRARPGLGAALPPRLRKTLPDDMGVLVAGLSSLPAPFVPAEHQGAPGCALVVVSFGSAEEHARVIAPVRADADPLFELALRSPTPMVQRMLDESAHGHPRVPVSA